VRSPCLVSLFFPQRNVLLTKVADTLSPLTQSSTSKPTHLTTSRFVSLPLLSLPFPAQPQSRAHFRRLADVPLVRACRFRCFVREGCRVGRREIDGRKGERGGREGAVSRDVTGLCRVSMSPASIRASLHVFCVNAGEKSDKLLLFRLSSSTLVYVASACTFLLLKRLLELRRKLVAADRVGVDHLANGVEVFLAEDDVAGGEVLLEVFDRLGLRKGVGCQYVLLVERLRRRECLGGGKRGKREIGK
jgi:hypothetical protein